MRVGRYINEVCLLLGTDLLVSIANEDAALFQWTKTSSVPLQVRVALGVSIESSEEPGYNMTRWYATEDELDEFCELNINRFRIAAKEHKDKFAPIPDATKWR